MLSIKEQEALLNLVEFAVEKRPDNEVFISILNKLKSLSVEGVPCVPLFQTEEIDDCLHELKLLANQYVDTEGGSPMVVYDEIKTKMAGWLQYLATHKDRYIDAANHYEDILKDQLKVRVMYAITNEQGISLNQAEKVVKGDLRYTEYRDKVYEIRKYANKLKSSYDIYSRIWQGVIQSVSTSKKEQNHIN